MCRVERMRPSMSSSSSRSPSRASMDRSSRQRRRRCSTISGNQTRCASPAATAHHLRLVPLPSGWRPSPDRCQDLSDPGDVLFWIGDFRVVLNPLQSTRALRLHRPCATTRCPPAMHETGVPANGRTTAAVARSTPAGRCPVRLVYLEAVPVSGEGAGTRVRGEATYSRAEGVRWSSARDDATLNQHFQSGVGAHTRSAESSTRHCAV
jgi:hypothetical protein